MLGLWLDSMLLKVFSNINDSVLESWVWPVGTMHNSLTHG